MAVNFTKEKPAAEAMVQAYKSGKDAEIAKAWQGLHKSIADQIMEDFKELQQTNDAAILAQRGYRQLTSQETKWYQKLIGAMKSSDPKQAFTTIIGTDNEEDLMPTTILQDVYKDLEEEHPLLAKINFQNVGYITKWILNDHTAQQAAWGEITDEIAKEITSGFKVVDINQAKLSAFAVIEKGMLDLGPTFMDAYVRRCLKEAMACGLEFGIVKGTGVNQPTGLIKDIHKGVSFNSETGYPNKQKETVTSFAPAEYGELVAKMAKKENGHLRKIGTVTLICNQIDYLTKIMPATTVMNANGTYVNDLFPLPTEVVVSNVLEEGEAVLALLPEYGMFVGGPRQGAIEYSDEYKFIEDQRVFKVKQYATGKAWDNTCALFLDITKVEPAYITVKNLETVTA